MGSVIVDRLGRRLIVARVHGRSQFSGYAGMGTTRDAFLVVIDEVDNVVEEPRQNQLRIRIADTDAEPRRL